MIKEKQEEAIKLTKEMLERYWQHDYEFALSLMSDDVIWIGANLQEHSQGKDKCRADFEAVDRELKSCHLQNQEYKIIHHTSTSVSVAGKYLVTTDPNEEVLLQVWQRCFANYIFEKGKFVLKGLHVSNPLGELHVVDDELFPNHLGRQAYQYVMENVRHGKQDKKLMIKAKDRTIHFIYESEIVSVRSNRHDIIISLREGEIVAAYKITDFYQEHQSSLVRTQRSLLVNPNHISHIKGNILVMDNGAELKIPPKIRLEAIAKIEEFMSGQ